MRRAGRAFALPLLLIPVVATWGCSDDITELNWQAAVDTAVLYSLDRPQLTLLSAFNFHERSPVRIESSGAATQWDLALDRRNGQLVLLPPGALGVTSEARVLQLPGMTFDQVLEAPKDTLLYTATLPLPVVLNTTYVVKTDLRATEFGGRCAYYAKLTPLTIDLAEGSLTFVYDSNPICNDRRLVPPDTGT